jgi:neutral ceramidase
MSKIYVGTGKADITPPVGVELTGYVARTSPSVGIRDRLYTRAFVVKDSEGGTAGLLICDLLGLDLKKMKVKRMAEELLGIPEDALIIACTHTHSGPATSLSLRMCGEPNKEWLSQLDGLLIQALSSALSSLSPCRIGFSRGETHIGINRRRRLEDGRVVIGPNPEGPVDRELLLLCAEDEKRIAVLMNHGCHPVVFGSDNLLISADYPGYAVSILEERIRERKGKEAFCAFANGACGDVNPRTRGGEDELREIGEELAGDAERLINGEMEFLEEGKVKARTKRVSLRCSPLPPKEEIEGLLSEAMERESSAKERGDEVALRVAKAEEMWARDMLKAREDGIETPEIEAEIGAIAIGPIVLVGIPGELFCELGMMVKGRAKAKLTMVIGYANGDIGYIPTSSSYRIGGYEVEESYKYYGLSQIAPGEGERMMEVAISLANELLSINDHHNPTPL